MKTTLSAAAVLACAALALLPQGCASDGSREAAGHGTIAFLTDFGESDFYVGAVKGVIRSIAPEVVIDDLGHQLEPYDVRRAAWNLYLAAREYPPGTVVLAVIDPGVGTERRAIVLRSRDGRLFVGPDNGLFTFVAGRLRPVEVRQITNRELFRARRVSSSFHGRDVFGPTAARLAAGVPFRSVGPLIDDYVLLPITPAEHVQGEVRGEVISIDHYGNLHTNIPDYLLLELEAERGDLLQVTVGEVTREAHLVNTYGDVPEGEPLILVASTDHLEVAVNMGQAKELFAATAGSPVVISPQRGKAAR